MEPNYFDTMGLRPVHGRAFEAAETSPGAVISNGVWFSEFSGDPSVLGRAIAVNGLPFTVVGVAEEALRAAEPARQLDAALIVRARGPERPVQSSGYD